MGRPPCCDKDGIKKGPWTPEEDIILVSYIQQHGPANWRSVPTNTGLQRCSKSCRLRWTNYLRPGIKRGNFTPHEEGMIIHLQAMLGNKWAAIASYLPQRTDNDIKNYWNTHLKKKLIKRSSYQQDQTQQQAQPPLTISSSSSHHNNDNNMVASSPQPKLSPTCYASSTENISRLLQSWMKCSAPSSSNNNQADFIGGKNNYHDNWRSNNNNGSCNDDHQDVTFDNHACGSEEDDHHQFDPMLSFEDLNNNEQDNTKEGKNKVGHDNMDEDEEDNPPLTFLEKWLLDESTTSSSTRQVVDEVLRLPSIF